jgi:hypothetical protein
MALPPFMMTPMMGRVGWVVLGPAAADEVTNDAPPADDGEVRDGVDGAITIWKPARARASFIDALADLRQLHHAHAARVAATLLRNYTPPTTMPALDYPQGMVMPALGQTVRTTAAPGHTYRRR